MTGDTHEPPKLPPEAVAALAAGNKIEAIKIVRVTQKVDLKTAKVAVESYVDLHPDLRAQFDSRRESTRGWLFWVVAAAVVWLLVRYLSRSQ